MVYPLRVLGMGLSVLPTLVVLRELGAGPVAAAWALFCCLAWPHLAWAHARYGRQAYRAELHNLAIDMLMAGSMIALIRFNLLPSVLFLVMGCADRLLVGIRGLWLQALLTAAAGCVAMGAVIGFQFQWTTSMPVLLACLPMLVVHTLATSLSSHRLVRKVRRQNLQLGELSRLDALTGLPNRRSWQEQAHAQLARHAEGQAASLVLLDADDFKTINDRHGHATGDDVLCGIAHALRTAMPADGHAGRLGGDEFAAVLPLPAAEALQVVERIRANLRALVFAEAAGLSPTLSIGLAEPPRAGCELREWFEAADRAMYAAKSSRTDRALAEATSA